MAGIRALRVRHTRRVKTAGIGMQMHFEKRIAGTKSPPIRYLPCCRGLDALGRSVQFVPQLFRVHKKGWHRVRIEERGEKLGAFKAGVGINKRGQIVRNPLRRLCSITRLVSDNVF